MKRMTLRDFCALVNEAAAQLHVLQGREGHVLPDICFEVAVEKLTEHFQWNFMDVKNVNNQLQYIVFPVEPSGDSWNSHLLDIPVFEVQWLVRALLGIALCRQALVIHREPKGPEPADSDKRLVQLLKQFIRQADPEIILEGTETEGDAECAQEKR